MRARFTELVTEAGVEYAARVAATVHLLYEGALVISTIANDPDALNAARDAIAHLLRGSEPLRAQRVRPARDPR
jgi:hypothetical protein